MIRKYLSRRIFLQRIRKKYFKKIRKKSSRKKIAKIISQKGSVQEISSSCLLFMTLYDTARVMYFSAMRRTLAGRGKKVQLNCLAVYCLLFPIRFFLSLLCRITAVKPGLVRPAVPGSHRSVWFRRRCCRRSRRSRQQRCWRRLPGGGGCCRI